MAVIAPNSEIYLIKCPIELDNLNQLSFASSTAQHNYFNGLPKLSLTNATFQRKDGTIRWPGSMESIIEYNYCMYRNKNHGNKWFYAFIDDIRYENDKMSYIKISTDVWQTWQFDLTFKASYVEREHTNDDTVGSNTIPEGLDTGEFVCNGIQEESYAKCELYPESTVPAEGAVMICIQLTSLKYTILGTDYQPSNPPTYNIVNGVPQGCYIVGIPYSQTALGLVYTLIGAYDASGKSDAIISMFLCPRGVTSWTKLTGTGIWNGNSYYKPDDSNSIHGFDLFNVNRNTTIDGYQPKNHKLFVGPYNYFYITNNAGTDIEFYYEDFINTSQAQFSISGCLEQGGSVKCYPTNSKKTSAGSGGSFVTKGYSEGIMGAQLPQLSWTSDYYLNWEAKNGKNVAIQTGLQAAGAALGILNPLATQAATHATSVDTAVQRGYFPDEMQMSVNAGGPLGSVVNFASSVANTQNQIRNAKLVPPQAKGNTVGGNIQFSADKCCFTIYKMSVREEYARCIDNYFSMFGYKTNRMKIPNITGRANWNYVKTVGCNIVADIPQGDLQAIKAMFNNGVTIWHNATTYLDYSQNNNII